MLQTDIQKLDYYLQQCNYSFFIHPVRDQRSMQNIVSSIDGQLIRFRV